MTAAGASSPRQVARALVAAGGRQATGGPPELFEAVGRDTMLTLLESGLAPSSVLLDFGCGWLRLAYWLVRFLDRDRYCGIEPKPDRVALGRQCVLTPELIELKAPRFAHNEDCDMSVFGERFDVVVARSVFTHMAPGLVRASLDSFRDNSTREGVFLASYWPATGPHAFEKGTLCDELDEDDMRPLWMASYTFEYIAELSRRVGLEVEELTPRPPLNKQIWLRFGHR